MKRTSIWFSILCALVILTGCFAMGEQAAETAEIPTEADCGELRFRIEGPDDRMPMEVSYEEFTDGSFMLEGLEPGEYTITEVVPEELLEGYRLQGDSVIQATVTVPEDGEATASLFNHYAAGEPEETEEPAPGPEDGEDTEEYISVSVRKEWDDGGNAMGLRPASIVVTLSNGSSYVLHAGNDWSATADHLPATLNGQPANYFWTEQEVPGYSLADVVTDGHATTLVNRMWQPPKVPAGNKQPKSTGETWYIFDEYETSLGLEIMINHVGDCYE